MWTEQQLAIFRRHLESRDKRDQAKSAADRAEKEYRESEADLWDMLTKDGELEMKDASIKVPLGDPYGTVTFSPRETIYGRVIDEDDFLEYLNNTAQTEEYTVPKFTDKRLNELARTLFEQKADFPAGFDFRPQRGVTLTRPKAKKGT